MEKFLSEVVHFQHFQQFIKNRMDKLNERRERDIFDEAIILFNEGNLLLMCLAIRNMNIQFLC